jgi:hypothetical protein
MRDYKVGSVMTFTLLSADIAPKGEEMETLHVQLRITNDSNDTIFPLLYGKIRLIVDRVPRAPDSTEAPSQVEGRSAKDGAVMFVIPRATRAVSLFFHDDESEIPLGLAAHR